MKRQRRLITQEEIIRKNLQQLISVHFQHRPFSEFIQFVANHAGINIVIDEAGLNEMGVSSDETITIDLDQVPVSTALTVVLKSLGLASAIEDEVLKVTSHLRAEGGLLVMVYQVEDLLSEEDDVALELERLIDTIRAVISPESWDQTGGPGSVLAHRDTQSLVIRQVRSVHTGIENLLREIRDVRLGKEPKAFTKITTPPAATVKQLRKPVAFHVRNVTLSDALRELHDQTGLQFYIDQQGLHEAGITVDQKVTLKIQDAVMGESLLKLLLHPLGLGYQPQDGVIVVTSTQKAADPLSVRLYPVARNNFEQKGLKSVCEELKSKIQPETWDTHGGSGVAQFDSASQTLIIRQSENVHKQIAKFLK